MIGSGVNWCLRSQGSKMTGRRFVLIKERFFYGLEGVGDALVNFKGCSFCHLCSTLHRQVETGTRFLF